MRGCARATTPPCSSRCARRRTPGRGARAERREPAALRRAGRGQGQYRRGRPADHRRLPGLRLYAAARRDSVARLRAAGAIVIGKTNLDQFATGLVGVRSPYGVPRNAIRAGTDPRRLELRLGGGGRRRRGAARARHRHRRLGPRAGRAQQYRRPQAEPRPRLDLWRGAGLPHARLRLGVCAHRRRRLGRACGTRRAGRARSLFAQSSARRARRHAGRAEARRAACRPAAVLRRQAVRSGL